MNKTELIAEIAERAEISKKDAEKDWPREMPRENM